MGAVDNKEINLCLCDHRNTHHEPLCLGKFLDPMMFLFHKRLKFSEFLVF